MSWSAGGGPFAVPTAHVVIGESTGAVAAYVGMTRGRTANTAHLIAVDLAVAREQWSAVVGRHRGDLGPAHAGAGRRPARPPRPRPRASLQELIALRSNTADRPAASTGRYQQATSTLRRQLTVDRRLITMPDRAPCPAPPKTQASVRIVRLPQVVIDAVAIHLATWPTDQFVPNTELGDPIRRTAFSERIWRPALKGAGLSDGTMHSLRHFYASLLIRHGESVRTAQARLGHASAAETLDT